MSEVKLISPLLDNFDIGDAISAHDGVRCYPAMRKGTDEKYIVKVISIPASRTQLDALLLTGAYPDEQSALQYFKALADDLAVEIQSMQQLSRLEGFLPFEGCQTVPMDGEVGYQVYLLSPYQRTLEKQFSREPMTHLSAVNLGLDLCASLSVCRRAGLLYVDLKPSNVYVTADKEYRIGDLGFVRIDSLLYASLPDKYRSAYTAPELSDPFASLNTTIDTYAVGLILYQAYNNGVLPIPEADGTVPPPEYADYEMAEIILKACAQDPEKRWQEPIQMGQALVSYMQRNGVNDTPIIPVPVVEVDQIIEAVNVAVENIGLDDQEAIIPDADAFVDEDVEIPAIVAVPAEEGTPVESDVLIENEAMPTDSENMETEPVADADIETAEAELAADTDTAITDAEPAAEETAPAAEIRSEEDGEFAFLMDINDETDPGTLTEAIAYSEVSDELNEILAQVDELAAMDVPEPVVAPEPIEVVVPPIVTEEPTQEEPQTVTEEDVVVIPEDAALPEDFEPLEHEPEVFEDTEQESAQDQEDNILALPPKKRSKGWIAAILVVLALLAIVAAAFLYYQNFYLLPIDSIKLDGNEDALVVLVDSDVDESLLKVVCSDSHGNQITLPVINGKATFENLTPNTAYNIKVVVDGFHRLTGNTATAYSTPAQTNIVQFSAVTGAEDGSVILGFTVEGPDDGQWSVVYSTPGETEQTVIFPSHMMNLTGLTVGKEYTFRLYSDTELFVTGINEITFTASKLVYAEDLIVTGFVDKKLSVKWQTPEDADVSYWTVRCYNDSDYNETIITAENTVVFEGLDHGCNYTVEVTAAGMSVSQRTFVAKNALTASNFQTDTSDPNKLNVSWDVNSKDATDGWLLLYTIDGGTKQSSVACNGTSAVINGVVPGAEYEITLQDATGAAVLCEPFRYTVPEAEVFSAYSVTAENMSFQLYKAPDIVYTNTFVPNDNIYMKISLGKRFSSSDDKITILFVTRDAEGKTISNSTTTLKWDDLWTYRECILAIPYTPEEAGEYTIGIYFNGRFITEQPYTVKNAAD